MDPSRAAELTDLIQRLDAEIPIEPELLVLVDQAMTHVSSGRARNLERLEFLGDAVLRLAATEFIDRHHADLTVGACSNLRAQMVSDRWLADVGEALCIEQHLVLGRHAQGDRSAQSRLRADATEALIGALHAALGNLGDSPLADPALVCHRRGCTGDYSSVRRQNSSAGVEPGHGGWDCPATPPKNAAASTVTPNASTAR